MITTVESRVVEEGRSTQFDPVVLDAFFTRRADIIQVQIDSADTA